MFRIVRNITTVSRLPEGFGEGELSVPHVALKSIARNASLTRPTFICTVKTREEPRTKAEVHQMGGKAGDRASCSKLFPSATDEPDMRQRLEMEKIELVTILDTGSEYEKSLGYSVNVPTPVARTALKSPSTPSKHLIYTGLQ